jgi:hypothetical protein
VRVIFPAAATTSADFLEAMKQIQIIALLLG